MTATTSSDQQCRQQCCCLHSQQCSAQRCCQRFSPSLSPSLSPPYPPIPIPTPNPSPLCALGARGKGVQGGRESRPTLVDVGASGGARVEPLEQFLRVERHAQSRCGTAVCVRFGPSLRCPPIRHHKVGNNVVVIRDNDVVNNVVNYIVDDVVGYKKTFKTLI